MRLRALGAILFAPVIGHATFAQTPTELSTALWTGVVRAPAHSWHVTAALPPNPSLASQSAVALDFPDFNAYGRSAVLTSSGSRIRIDRSLPNGSHIVFDGQFDGDSLFGAWSGYGHQAPFTLRRQRDPVPRFRAESVVFANGDVRLAGTLVLPISTGAHAAFVCIHGSGPVERSAYESKAIFFARHGIAVLIYDKRGTGQSSGDWQTAAPGDLAGDALAGVELLRSHAGIDPARIGVEGFSQGGWIAPLAASRSRHVAFVIVGSPAGVNPAEQSIYNVAHQLAGAGFDSAVVERASTLRRRLYASARDSAAFGKVGIELEAASSEPWFKASALPASLGTALPSIGEITFLELEPREIWSGVRVPVLAYWGNRDTRVPVDSSQRLISGVLARSGNTRLTTHRFDGADHTMMLAAPGDATWDFPRTAPSFDLMLRWLEALLGRRL